MTSNLVPINDTFIQSIKVVRESNTPSKEVIIALTRAAHQEVMRYLAEDNMTAAIDTMEKTKAIEDYVKAKVKHQQAQLYHANLITKARIDILREMGWWLDEHVAQRGIDYYPENPGNRFIKKLKIVNSGKPKFFLKEIGVSGSESFQWQMIASMPEEDYNEWVDPFLHDGVHGKELQLTVPRLYTYLKPSKPKESEDEILADLVPETKSYYRGFKNLKEATGTFIEQINENKIPVKDILFMRNIIHETQLALQEVKMTLDGLANEKIRLEVNAKSRK